MASPGADGANAPHVQFQYSDTGRTPWSATEGPNSEYFRTSVDGGTTWSNAIKFKGDDGVAGGVGPQGPAGPASTVPGPGWEKC